MEKLDGKSVAHEKITVKERTLYGMIESRMTSFGDKKR